MACCDLKQGTGKCLVFFFTIVFVLGVTISTLTPNFITFVSKNPSSAGTTEVQWGPLYGQYRTCMTENTGCGAWESKVISLSDCDSVEETEGADLQKLCTQLGTFRVTGGICLILVLIGGALVLAASCFQCVTCGCCGNSLTCMANFLFWVEVILSIVVWSFAISSLNLIKSSPTVSSSGYQWGFWLFVFTGTVVGAISAWMADWAAEDSFARKLWHTIKWFLLCRMCRKDKDDKSKVGDDDDKVEPLIGENGEPAV